MTSGHDQVMRRAIALSELGYPAPNPHVGCVIIRDGEVVGEGHHEAAGGPHAEAAALAFAGGRARGATVYVTLEPCSHYGRTPPCARALIQAGVKEVFVACSDPNPLAAGGADFLRESGIPVTMGLLADDAAWVNRQFLLHQAIRRPLVSLKAAVTQEGFIARLDGTSKWITEPAAREHGHRLRALRGAVLVGRRTVELDHPSLTARIPGVQHQPRRIVLDPQAQVDPGEACLAPSQGLRVVGKRTGREGDLYVEAPEGRFSLKNVAESLGGLGVTGLLVEGGGATHRAFLEEGLADEVHLYRSPRTFGEGIPWDGGLGINLEGSGWSLLEEERLGPDLRQFWAKKAEIMGTIRPRNSSE